VIIALISGVVKLFGFFPTGKIWGSSVPVMPNMSLFTPQPI
jgi:hypothetical protein